METPTCHRKSRAVYSRQHRPFFLLPAIGTSFRAWNFPRRPFVRLPPFLAWWRRVPARRQRPPITTQRRRRSSSSYMIRRVWLHLQDLFCPDAGVPVVPGSPSDRHRRHSHHAPFNSITTPTAEVVVVVVVVVLSALHRPLSWISRIITTIRRILVVAMASFPVTPRITISCRRHSQSLRRQPRRQPPVCTVVTIIPLRKPAPALRTTLRLGPFKHL